MENKESCVTGIKSSTVSKAEVTHRTVLKAQILHRPMLEVQITRCTDRITRCVYEKVTRHIVLKVARRTVLKGYLPYYVKSAN
ncbi:unnamed protein product [Onchocerca ochengi]|uniref:30S ribosomal protein S17 n=1 Tax=Onchocerca ochengi TaxID=42157 RepID=A0A182EX45_ONCOC|nr:unnamed protein product [Onchocerca ochengi]